MPANIHEGTVRIAHFKTFDIPQHLVEF